MSWWTCRECEAHTSWCDHPDTHTWRDIDPGTDESPTLGENVGPWRQSQ